MERKVSPRIRSQQQVNGLRGGNQNIARPSRKACPLSRRRITRADGQSRFVHRYAPPTRHLSHTHQRRAQIAFHVDRQRFDRRYVEHPAPFGSRWRRHKHQPVNGPQEGRRRLSGSSRSKYEGGFAACNRRPAQALRRSRSCRGMRLRASPAQRSGKQLMDQALAGTAGSRLSHLPVKSMSQRHERVYLARWNAALALAAPLGFSRLSGARKMRLQFSQRYLRFVINNRTSHSIPLASRSLSLFDPHEGHGIRNNICRYFLFINTPIR